MRPSSLHPTSSHRAASTRTEQPFHVLFAAQLAWKAAAPCIAPRCEACSLGQEAARQLPFAVFLSLLCPMLIRAALPLSRLRPPGATRAMTHRHPAAAARAGVCMSTSRPQPRLPPPSRQRARSRFALPRSWGIWLLTTRFPLCALRRCPARVHCRQRLPAGDFEQRLRRQMAAPLQLAVARAPLAHLCCARVLTCDRRCNGNPAIGICACGLTRSRR